MHRKFYEAIVPSSVRARLKPSQVLMDLFGTSRSLTGFRFTGDDPRADIAAKYGFTGDLADIYAAGSDALVHKWHHYLPVYDRHFAPWRSRPVRFLEIGVSEGGSLSMWRRYFGDQAIIFGIDVNQDCQRFDGIDAQVRIGSQDDPDFLRRVVDEMGGVDVILDDGSHVMRHIRASLEALFPRLSDGGTYMIEDLHTAYWKDFGGGYWRRGNFFNDVRALIDGMHRWYHVSDSRHAAVAEACRSIHIYDSICVIEKGIVPRPTRSKVGPLLASP